MRKTTVFIFWIISWLFTSCAHKNNGNVYTGVLEGKTIQVPAMTGGKIVALQVEIGQEVHRHDTLAVVDSTELFLQWQQVQAGLKGLQVQSEIARTTLQRAGSDLKYFREKYHRTETLVANHSLPQQTLDDLKVQMDRAEAAVKTARESLHSLAAQQEQFQAQLQTLRKKIRDCFILSPADGIVANTYFEQGEAVPPLNPVVEILHIRSLEVKIYMAEKKLPWIKYGQEVRVRVDGLNREMKGKITWISSKAEFTPKTILTPETRSSLVYAVKITIPNPEGVLKHGMPVEVIL